MTRDRDEHWYDLPGLLGLVVVGGALGVLIVLASLFGWW